MKIGCYLTVNGTAWCLTPMSQTARYSDITCGHRSLAAAGRARKEVKRRAAEWTDVRVVRGHCPV